MKETDVTVVGNVVNPPQRSRTASGASVTNFRVASTSRRFDRETQEWTDNRTLFVDVECWGELGGNVSHTLSKGDPVIVHGQLYTREWESENGPRSRPQMRAEAVGPDLSRGVADFRRTARTTPAPGAPAEPPVDPFAERPTDYDGGDVTLEDVDADAPTDADDLEPSLT